MTPKVNGYIFYFWFQVGGIGIGVAVLGFSEGSRDINVMCSLEFGQMVLRVSCSAPTGGMTAHSSPFTSALQQNSPRLGPGAATQAKGRIKDY